MSHSHMKNIANLGFFVDESAVGTIEDLNENDFFKLVEHVKKENPLMINKDVVNKAIVNDVRIVRNFTPMSRFTIQDVVKNLSERFSSLQGILLRRVEFSDMVSINKLSSGNASIIGIVNDKLENGNNMTMTLEDSTGIVQVIIPKYLGEKLSLDDVVAVSGKISNKVLLADKLVYPDVPIRPVNYSSRPVKISFIEDGRKAASDYVFYKERVEDNIKIKTHITTAPYISDVDGVIVLVLPKANPLDAIRKRYVSLEKIDFIIDPVPDIIFTDTDVNTNYKGITIASINKTVDLKTREVSNI